MALYQDTWKQLSKYEPSKEFFRFEGARTCSRINLNGEYGDGYIYISKSLDHHMYFTMKRLKQMLNSSLLKSEQVPFVSRTLRSDDVYPRIKKLILNGENIGSLYSHRLICPKSFDILLKDNCYQNTHLKNGKKMIERADRRVFGGGYGIAEEWKDLLSYLTYFTATTRISRNDILDVVSRMKATGRMTSKDHIRDIVTDIDRYQFKINPHILSDFNKYEIVNALEVILEKGLIRDGSELSENPRKTMRELIDQYERGRERSIKVLEKKIDLQGELL